MIERFLKAILLFYHNLVTLASNLPIVFYVIFAILDRLSVRTAIITDMVHLASKMQVGGLVTWPAENICK